MNLDPKDIVSVSIMPCTAKKFEIQRPDEAANGIPDVDYSLTTKGLARMIRKVGLKFTTLRTKNLTLLWDLEPVQLLSSAQPAVLWRQHSALQWNP